MIKTFGLEKKMLYPLWGVCVQNLQHSLNMCEIRDKLLEEEIMCWRIIFSFLPTSLALSIAFKVRSNGCLKRNSHSLAVLYIVLGRISSWWMNEWVVAFLKENNPEWSWIILPHSMSFHPFLVSADWVIEWSPPPSLWDCHKVHLGHVQPSWCLTNL